MRRLLPILFALTACSAEPDAPGQVTADEAELLNEAAAMLDANSVTLNDIPADNAEDAP